MGILNRWQKKEQEAARAQAGDQVKDSAPTTKTVKKTEAKKVSATERNAQAVAHIVRPVISEKATVAASHGAYTFEVPVSSNKVEVKKAVAALYGVTPRKVTMVITGGKTVRYGRTVGKRAMKKKAIVMLPEGKTIDIYKGV